MKRTGIVGIIVLTFQLVIGKRSSMFQRQVPLRVCSPHQPLAISDQFSCEQELASNSNVTDSEADKGIIQISVENGYKIESYNVTTSDGYVLTTFRISGGRKSPVRIGKPAVLLLHGWGNSAEGWIALPNDKNLAFMLADAGWDVWLGNHRGSSFSLGHKTLNADTDLEYWDFSFQEMGQFDLPVMVDQIRTVSGNDKIFVIGHSQGGGAVLVGTSEIPNLNDKIHAAYLMAPAAYFGGLYDAHLSAILPIINTPAADELYTITKGRIQIQNSEILSLALGMGRYDLCEARALRCGLCDLFKFGPFRFNPAQMNYTNLPRMVSKLLNIGTVRSIIHFGQNARSCSFRKYDFGVQENMRRYNGLRDPPSYNLKRIKVPLYIFWGEQDATISPSDIQRLIKDLSRKTIRGVIRVNDDTFEHFDFLVARDANKLVYKPLVNMMNKFWDGVAVSTSKS